MPDVDSTACVNPADLARIMLTLICLLRLMGSKVNLMSAYGVNRSYSTFFATIKTALFFPGRHS